MIINKENNKIIRRFSKIRDCKTPMPISKTKCSAGYDIITPVDIVIEPKNEKIIHTGLIYETTETDECLVIYPRSGLGFKYCRLANSVGIIDSDYEGEIVVKLRNEGNESIFIEKGKGIAQAIIQPFLRLSPDNREVNNRGIGGFGSTD